MTKILISGDFAPKCRVADYIEKGDYDKVFNSILQYTSEVDYSILNFESPVVESFQAKPIEKYGPHLKCTSKAVKAMKYAGFNMATLANNHFYDYGEIGVNDTLAACKNEGIDTVGGGNNITEASKTLYKEIKGVRFAFINCCEREFSIATETSGGSNPLNPIKQYYAITEAKTKADRVIVIVHGGHEQYQLPSPRMKETYRFFVDAGADVVVNHHQHCYSGYEVYNSKPIFYGLGNFCFDYNNKKKSSWNEGYMVELSFEGSDVSFKLIPYIQGFHFSGVMVLSDSTEIQRFQQSVELLNSTINNDKELKRKHIDYMDASKRRYLACLEPYNNRYLKAAYVRGYLPSFISSRKALVLKNYFECISHFERLINAIHDI